MKMNYDTVADALYFKVNEGKIRKTMTIDDRMVVDVDKKGNILGIEILNASLQGMNKIRKAVKKGIPVKITPVAA